jgi:hypothetical protein
MNDIPLKDIDRWAMHCEMAADSAAEAAALLHMGRADEAAPLVGQARDAARELLQCLSDAGARSPQAHPAGTPLPLDKLSTANTRRLLATLRAAVAEAEAVDAERGNVLPGHIPLQPGESRGTGWAESISNLTERLRIEVEGPRGRE